MTQPLAQAYMAQEALEGYSVERAKGAEVYLLQRVRGFPPLEHAWHGKYKNPLQSMNHLGGHYKS